MPKPGCKPLLKLRSAVASLALIACISSFAAQAQQPAAPAPVETAPVEPAAPAAAPTTDTPAPTPPVTAPAVKVLPPEVNDTINTVVGTMEGAEKSLTAITSVDTDLGRLRDQIDEVISKTTRTADSLRPRLGDIQNQIDQLGPAPEKDAAPEAPTAAAERARLAAEASELGGAIKTLEVTWWRARQAIDKITDLRLQLFVRSLTERMTSPLFPDLWKSLVRDAPGVSWRVKYNTNDWLSAIDRQKANFTVLLAAAAALYLLLKALVARMTRYRPEPNAPVPTFFQRAASASWIAPARAIPGVATAFLLYAGLDYLGLLYYPTAAPTGVALFRAALVFILVASLLSAVFAPSQPERRLVALSNRSARRICRLLQILAAIYAADLFFSAFSQILYFPLSMSVVQSLIASVAFAGVLMALLLTPFESINDTGEVIAVRRNEPRWLKFPLWIAAAAIIVACLLGYVALGRFLAQQIVMTGVVALVGTLLFLAIRAFTRENDKQRTGVSIFLEKQAGFDDVRRRQLAWVTESILSIGVLMITLPVLLLQWGFSGADIRDWFKSLFFGFEIGQFKISLFRILLGIILFVALLLATRLVQRRLRENILIQPRMDPGIANSIDTTVGYAGTGLAAIVAISYAGFDITSLAIVAGALSVGIGFGLQSIVNNFVSGLILLIERPIKVGDWVVVGNEQGNVKRISVRSTEIETFDRASLIVPNSELVTGRVLNWTHRNALGRVVLKFNAGPNADPRKVLAVLNECAKKNPDILREPAPLAVFEGYSATATDYSLRVLLPDITRGLRVQSELRIAVFEALRNAQIEVPTAPQPQAAPVPMDA
ncbi:MAG: mechanosensitive ion channel protein MscS [Hyphomicrobium sp.]|nr:MAG: mechanosensitive ion channel protein MscS [Hyphomicrobium sp.]